MLIQALKEDSMKNSFLVLTLLFTAPAFAQTTTPAPVPTLAQNMDSISALVKSITKNVNDPTQNAASAASAAQLVQLFTTTLSQVPTSIATLPANQQAQATAGYQSLIQKEIDDAQALQNAFLANDTAAALNTLQDMNTIKSQGHSTYAH
jgi:hypothetical protein